MPQYQFTNLTGSRTPLPSNIGGMLEPYRSKTLDLHASDVDRPEVSKLVNAGVLRVIRLGASAEIPDAIELGIPNGSGDSALSISAAADASTLSWGGSYTLDNSSGTVDVIIDDPTSYVGDVIEVWVSSDASANNVRLFADDLSRSMNEVAGSGDVARVVIASGTYTRVLLRALSSTQIGVDSSASLSIITTGGAAPGDGDGGGGPVSTPASGDITLGGTYPNNTYGLQSDTTRHIVGGNLVEGAPIGAEDRFAYSAGFDSGSALIYNADNSRWELWTGVGNVTTVGNGNAMPGSAAALIASVEVDIDDGTSGKGPDPDNLLSGTGTLAYATPAT